LIIDCSVSGENLEIVHGGTLNNKASDEKESLLARNRRVTSSFSLAGIAAFVAVSVLDTQTSDNRSNSLIFLRSSSCVFYILADLH
jgi:hypothetical protein